MATSSAAASIPARARYAVYFAPAHDSEWWRFGAGWLGRDETTTPTSIPMVARGGLGDRRWRELTAEPRRYGFHATLKAPFRLAEGVGVDELREQTRALAQTLQAVRLDRFEVRPFPGFIALVPQVQASGLQELAARCVMELDHLRAPLDAQDRARRRPERLDERGRELLERFGYPLVLERFRFHMTLATGADPQETESLVAAASQAIEPIQRRSPPILDRLSLFEESQPGADLMRIGDFVFPD